MLPNKFAVYAQPGLLLNVATLMAPFSAFVCLLDVRAGIGLSLVILLFGFVLLCFGLSNIREALHDPEVDLEHSHVVANGHAIGVAKLITHRQFLLVTAEVLCSRDTWKAQRNNWLHVFSELLIKSWLITGVFMLLATIFVAIAYPDYFNQRFIQVQHMQPAAAITWFIQSVFLTVYLNVLVMLPAVQFALRNTVPHAVNHFKIEYLKRVRQL